MNKWETTERLQSQKYRLNAEVKEIEKELAHRKTRNEQIFRQNLGNLRNKAGVLREVVNSFRKHIEIPVEITITANLTFFVSSGDRRGELTLHRCITNDLYKLIDYDTIFKKFPDVKEKLKQIKKLTNDLVKEAKLLAKEYDMDVVEILDEIEGVYALPTRDHREKLKSKKN